MLKKILSVVTSVVLVLAFTVTSYAYSIGSIGYTDKAVVFVGVKYGSHERQVFDLFVPKSNDLDIGLVLFIHGGAYTSGDKSSYWEQCEDLSNDGYPAATMNYRYMDENVSLHDILQDIDDCLWEIRSLGEDYNLDINRVLIRGYSAGGHLAMLYAYSRKDTAPIQPTAVVSDAGGPADCSDPYFYRNNILFDAEGGAAFMSKACDKNFTFATRNYAKKDLLAISPLNYIRKGTVATLLSYGYLDTIIPYQHGCDLAAKLYNSGCTVHFVEYGNSDHGLSNDSKKEKETKELFNQYVKYMVGT